MITIHHVEIHFEVEGDGDEAVFARLFEKYLARASRLQAEAERRRCRTEAERTLSDRTRGRSR